MNILRSFTETVVTTPTDTFPISFEYEEKYDAVHVFLDDVAVEDLGYTVSHANSVTLKIVPPIPKGTVRIERETDIDNMKYIFDAGALFIEQNVDADFKQLVHAQQEVRDGFVKLRGDVLPLVDGLEAALQSAKEASDAAQDAAEAAQDAANTVRSHTTLTDRELPDAHPTSAIMDTLIGKTQEELNMLYRQSRVVDLRLYGLQVNTDNDQTAVIHAAFQSNPNNLIFYFPEGVVKANIIIPRNGIVLLGDTQTTSFIEPFDLTKTAVNYNKKLYITLMDITVQADQTYTAEQLIDARDTRYKSFINADIRKITRTGQTHKYETILVDDRCVVATWTGYNRFKNSRVTFGSYGYLADPTKLNSVLEMIGCVFSFNGYFNIKTAASNSTLINMDVANGGKLQPTGTYDETMYGGIYIRGDNTTITGVWHELNAHTTPSYSPNNVYIHPDSWNISHNFARDTRGSNNVRIYTLSQGQLQDVNTADRSMNDGQGRARPNQLLQNGNFKYFTGLTRPVGWNGYFSGTWSQETVDLPLGYSTGLKVVSTVAGNCGVYQAIYNPADLSNSYIKDLSKWVGREITVSFWVKNIGTSATAIRAGISTDATNVYFSSGNFVSNTRVGAYVKVIASIKITGNEPRIWAGIRVAGVGEGFIVTGYSCADDCRVNDAQSKPITEDGGVILGDLDVQGGLTRNGVAPLFRPTLAVPTALSNKAAPINTVDKFAGRQVFNTTDSLMYYATGDTPTSTWKSFDSTKTITPV